MHSQVEKLLILNWFAFYFWSLISSWLSESGLESNVGLVANVRRSSYEEATGNVQRREQGHISIGVPRIYQQMMTSKVALKQVTDAGGRLPCTDLMPPRRHSSSQPCVLQLP